MKLIFKNIMSLLLIILFCLPSNVNFNYASPMSAFSNNKVNEIERLNPLKANGVVDVIINNGFDERKKICNEWSKNGEKYYYFDSDGEKVINCWYKIDNEWYRFNENAEMLQSEWIFENADYYYVGQDGIMYRNKWLQENGRFYYFDLNGKLVKQNWVQNIYYVDENGEMLKNTTKLISGKTYIFDASGKGLEVLNNNNKSISSRDSSGGPWYTKSGSCYHEKYGCSGATIPYPPKNKSYRPCSKCCH